MYYLRFTETPEKDLARNTSLLDLPTMSEPKKLDGLCGFLFEAYEEFERGLINRTEVEFK